MLNISENFRRATAGVLAFSASAAFLTVGINPALAGVRSELDCEHDPKMKLATCEIAKNQKTIDELTASIDAAERGRCLDALSSQPDKVLIQFIRESKQDFSSNEAIARIKTSTICGFVDKYNLKSGPQP